MSAQLNGSIAHGRMRCEISYCVGVLVNGVWRFKDLPCILHSAVFDLDGPFWWPLIQRWISQFGHHVAP
jgi:hypothetical protein